MKLELEEKDVYRLWHCLQQQEDPLAEKVKKAATEQGIDIKVGTLRLSGGNIFIHKQGEDFIKVPGVASTIPIKVLEDAGTLLLHWPLIVETIQALELRDIPAHKFFHFPTFEIDGETFQLVKNNFLLGNHFLFNITDLPKLLEFVKNG